MVEVTKKAEKMILKALSDRREGIGIRLGMKTTGCNGYAYTLEFADKTEEHDNVFEKNGYSIVIEDKAMVFMDGLTIDYVKNGLNEGFEYINPNEKSRCGCGESFEV